MTRGRTGNASGSGGVLDGALEDGFMQVVPPPLAWRLVEVEPRRGKHPLPSPFHRVVRVLHSERTGEGHAPTAGHHVRVMLRLDLLQMIEKRPAERDRQHRHAVLPALAV